MEQKLARWHKKLAPTVGAMARAIVLRRVRPSEMTQWADTLDEASRQIRAAASALDGRGGARRRRSDEDEHL